MDEMPITLGVEEEFFLVDPDTRDLVADPPAAIFEACEKNAGPHKVVREFMRSQVETNTRVCGSVAELREAIQETRRVVVAAAEAHGARVLATSTHPFGAWESQATTPRERYRRFAVTFQESVRRFLVAGMHIHAGFADANTRIRVMTALRRYLPILHALSASSPFNAGRETGFKSYRLNLIGALPRTSLPPPLASADAYEALVAGYQALDFIGDGSELWWDIRPSARFPTIELRICDICTRMEDALCVAALFAALIRKLQRDLAAGALPEEPATELIAENRWLATRYGVLAFLADTRFGGRLDIDEITAALVQDLAEDTQALGCEAEAERALTIIREGTGADRQIDLYRLRRLEGDSGAEALRAVVDDAVAATREGLD